MVKWIKKRMEEGKNISKILSKLLDEEVGSGFGNDGTGLIIKRVRLVLLLLSLPILLRFLSSLCRPLLLILYLQVLLSVLICLLCNLNLRFLHFVRLKLFNVGKKSASLVIAIIVNRFVSILV